MLAGETSFEHHDYGVACALYPVVVLGLIPCISSWLCVFELSFVVVELKAVQEE